MGPAQELVRIAKKLDKMVARKSTVRPPSPGGLCTRVCKCARVCVFTCMCVFTYVCVWMVQGGLGKEGFGLHPKLLLLTAPGGLSTHGCPQHPGVLPVPPPAL